MMGPEISRHALTAAMMAVAADKFQHRPGIPEGTRPAQSPVAGGSAAQNSAAPRARTAGSENAGRGWKLEAGNTLPHLNAIGNSNLPWKAVSAALLAYEASQRVPMPPLP